MKWWLFDQNKIGLKSSIFVFLDIMQSQWDLKMASKLLKNMKAHTLFYNCEKKPRQKSRFPRLYTLIQKKTGFCSRWVCPFKKRKPRMREFESAGLATP